jgi:energy-coupling factor transport system ATP-binding protein
MIEVRDLSFSYDGEREVLQEINIDIREGSYVAIMGDNGAGKSTLVRHFNGLLKPTKGSVLVDGLDTKKQSVSSLSRKIALVFQYPESMFFSETVHEEMAFALKAFGFSDEIAENRVRRYSTLFGLQKYEKRSPFTLSGGEQRRLAMACVLTWGPKYVVLDEPTAGQDQVQRELLMGIIRQLLTQGKTVVVVSHDVEFVAETSPHVFLMSKGRVIDEGEARLVLSNQEAVRRAGLILPQVTEAFAGVEELSQSIVSAEEATEEISRSWGDR